MNITTVISKNVFALIMGIYGIQHFMYAAFVASMIPGWIPFHLFWAYFTGIALIAAAVSMVINLKAKLACLLLGVMLWMFILIIHSPILIGSHFAAGDITSACKDMGLASAAFMLAGIVNT